MWNDVSILSMFFWFFMTCAGIYVLNIVDGTNKWYREDQKRIREGYRPLK